MFLPKQLVIFLFGPTAQGEQGKLPSHFGKLPPPQKRRPDPQHEICLRVMKQTKNPLPCIFKALYFSAWPNWIDRKLGGEFSNLDLIYLVVFHQPIWKICSSDRILFPRDRGEKWKMFETTN